MRLVNLNLLTLVTVALLAGVLLIATPALTATTTTVEGESMSLSDSVATAISDSKASGGKVVAFWSNGSAKTSYDGSVEGMSITLRGQECSDPPRASVLIDGKVVAAIDVKSTSYYTWSFSASAANSNHTIEIRYANDHRTSYCDRNLFLDKLTVTGTSSSTSLAPTTPTGANPWASEQFYVNPKSSAQKSEDSLRAAGRTADAEAMRKISESPAAPYYMAEWTEKYNGIAFYTDYYIKKYRAAGAVPTLGLYAIPNRDCGSYSGGGFTTADQYKAWIDKAATGSGTNKVIWILEPDAIPYWDCLTTAQQQERVDLLSYTITRLKSNPNAYVYLDVGHSGWHQPATIIDRLKRANIAAADGFTTNTSNFNYTSNEVSWGKQVSAGIGNKPFVVDTSRNGVGPYTGGTHHGDCPPQINPPDRALGSKPTTNTGDSLVHAYFWLKQPGESDGACGPFPSAGTWVEDYALGLANASPE